MFGGVLLFLMRTMLHSSVLKGTNTASILKLYQGTQQNLKSAAISAGTVDLSPGLLRPSRYSGLRFAIKAVSGLDGAAVDWDAGAARLRWAATPLL